MPTLSKFPGYLLVGPDEGFKVGDYFSAVAYKDLRANAFDLEDWRLVDEQHGPRFPGQSFRQRYGVRYTVIRKATKKPGIPVRLALSKTFSKPLPLP